jgi:hypothetical protein
MNGLRFSLMTVGTTLSFGVFLNNPGLGFDLGEISIKVLLELREKYS